MSRSGMSQSMMSGSGMSMMGMSQSGAYYDEEMAMMVQPPPKKSRCCLYTCIIISVITLAAMFGLWWFQDEILLWMDEPQSGNNPSESKKDGSKSDTPGKSGEGTSSPTAAGATVDSPPATWTENLRNPAWWKATLSNPKTIAAVVLVPTLCWWFECWPFGGSTPPKKKLENTKKPPAGILNTIIGGGTADEDPVDDSSAWNSSRDGGFSKWIWPEADDDHVNDSSARNSERDDATSIWDGWKDSPEPIEEESPEIYNQDEPSEEKGALDTIWGVFTTDTPTGENYDATKQVFGQTYFEGSTTPRPQNEQGIENVAYAAKGAAGAALGTLAKLPGGLLDVTAQTYSGVCKEIKGIAEADPNAWGTEARGCPKPLGTWEQDLKALGLPVDWQTQNRCGECLILRQDKDGGTNEWETREYIPGPDGDHFKGKETAEWIDMTKMTKPDRKTEDWFAWLNPVTQYFGFCPNSEHWKSVHADGHDLEEFKYCKWHPDYNEEEIKHSWS